MSKVTPEHSASLMGTISKGGKLADHQDCIETISRLVRERDQATAQRDNLRTALVAAIGLKRACDVESLGFKVDAQRRKLMKIEAA